MRRFLLPSFFAALIITGCSKSEDSETSPAIQFTATVNGLPWQATSYQASIYQGSIIVIGKASDGAEITMNLSGDSLGLYGMNETSSSSGSYRLSAGSGNSFTTDASPTAGGQAYIESINNTQKKITGAFNFTGVRASDSAVVTITGGRFVDLIYETIPIGKNLNSMNMKVGGNNWRPIEINSFIAFQKLHISAFDGGSQRNLTFELPEQIAPGNYELNYFTSYQCYYTNQSGTKFYAITGNLNIESHHLVSRLIKGSFDIKLEDFEGKTKINITEGSFEITYQ